MILTCPQCATRYEIDAAKFPAAGRKVRCKKCAHVWFQPGSASDAPVPAPQVPTPAPKPADVSPTPPIFREDASEPDQDPVRAFRKKISIDDAPAPERVVEKNPADGNVFARAATIAGWIGLIVVILIIGWSATSYREQIASVWPRSATLFAHMGMAVNRSGLDFADVQHMIQVEDGQPVLVITGKIVNVSARQKKVPPLRITLNDGGKRNIYGWSFSPKASFLSPGQSVAFRTRLSNPPSAARHVDIHFADGAE